MKSVVVISGAGISAESGLKTFRGADGLWRGYRPEDVASPEAWRRDPGLVLDFYNERRKAVREAQPNAAHLALVELERAYDVRIVTQNVDDLHERAGSSSSASLRRASWVVVRVWERDVKRHLDSCVRRISRAIQRRGTTGNHSITAPA